MKSIIPEQSQSTIFDKLIQAAMDDFISEGEVFALHVISFKFWSLVDFSMCKNAVKVLLARGAWLILGFHHRNCNASLVCKIDFFILCRGIHIQRFLLS